MHPYINLQSQHGWEKTRKKKSSRKRTFHIHFSLSVTTRILSGCIPWFLLFLASSEEVYCRLVRWITPSVTSATFASTRQEQAFNCRQRTRHISAFSVARRKMCFWCMSMSLCVYVCHPREDVVVNTTIMNINYHKQGDAFGWVLLKNRLLCAVIFFSRGHNNMRKTTDEELLFLDLPVCADVRRSRRREEEKEEGEKKMSSMYLYIYIRVNCSREKEHILC